VKTGRYRFGRICFILACLLHIAFFFISCASEDPSLKFAAALLSIDSCIAGGKTDKAERALAHLRKSASSTSQWLSIVKRERSLGKNADAVTTLKSALKKLPANNVLTAVLVDTLINEARLDEACAYSSSLIDTPYAYVSAFPELKRAFVKDSPLADVSKIDPRFYISSFRMTDNPVFLRDAAVVYAVGGKLAAACELIEKEAFGAGVNADERLFRATLCYDTGMNDRVFEYLPVSEKDTVGAEALALMADTAWKQKNTVLSENLWETAIAYHPDASPIPYYNISVMAENALDEKKSLESCLAHFSSYYPAVVRYVRSAGETVEKTERDPAEEMLVKAGFQSLEMEEKASRKLTSLSDAHRVLAKALEATSGTSDIRFIIEDLRLTSREKPDIARSTAAIWILLEKYPDNAILRSYACWYFLSIHEFEACFKLNKESKNGEVFYSGLEAVSLGDFAKAEELFSKIANDDENAWRALADIGWIREKSEDYQGAIDSYSLAAQLDHDRRTASSLHFEAARLLAGLHFTDKAITILRYSINLDPSNYRSAALLRELESAL